MTVSMVRARVFLANLLAILFASCHVFLRDVFLVLFCARIFLARILLYLSTVFSLSLARVFARILFVILDLAMILPKTRLVEFVDCSISTF